MRVGPARWVPAGAGSRPEQGVKLVPCTCHFVSADPSVGCALQEASIFQHGGVFYHVVKPLTYENTPTNLVENGHGAVPTFQPFQTKTRSIKAVRFTALTSCCRTENTSADPVKNGQACLNGDAMNEEYVVFVVPGTNAFASGFQAGRGEKIWWRGFHDVVAAGLPQKKIWWRVVSPCRVYVSSYGRWQETWSEGCSLFADGE